MSLMVTSYDLKFDGGAENCRFSRSHPARNTSINRIMRLDVLNLLCATSVFSVTLWLMNSEQKLTTESQRTQRLHREERDFCIALNTTASFSSRHTIVGQNS